MLPYREAPRLITRPNGLARRAYLPNVHRRIADHPAKRLAAQLPWD